MEIQAINIIRYNGLARFLHWLMAVFIFGLAALGFYMMNLTYYDPWYQTAPNLHRSFGVVVFALVCLRWSWRQVKPPPALSDDLKPFEKIAAHLVHNTLYGLMFLLPISGYFITTAKGESVKVFGLFEIPSIFNSLDQQPIANFEDIAGFVHLGLAVTLLLLVALHAVAGLKHHFFEGGDSLKKML